MTDRGPEPDPDRPSAEPSEDDIFAAGGGRPPVPPPSAPEDEVSDANDRPSGWTTDDAPDGPASPYPDGPASPYPDGPASPYPDGPASPYPDGPDSPYPDGPDSPYPGAAGPPPRQPPRSDPGSAPGSGPAPYSAGPGYPAGPSYPAQPGSDSQQAFGRRAPRRGPQPDAQGYYPSDYYVGPDWMRIVLGGLAAAIIGIALVGGGIYLYDRYAPTDDDDVTAVATPTPLPLVPVYQCAGDAQPVTEMMAPSGALIAGRTADSRWLAFRNPSAPPLQLWVRSTSVPDFEPQEVGIVSCASSPTEFPTPLSAGPALLPTPTPLAPAEPG